MPWKTEKRGNRIAVVKKGSGDVISMQPTQEKADAQVRALYANADPSDYKGTGVPAPKKNRSAKQNRLRSAAARRASKFNKSKKQSNRSSRPSVSDSDYA